MNINPKLLSDLIQASVKKALKEQLPILLEREMNKIKNELLVERRSPQPTTRTRLDSKKPNSFSQKYQLSPKKKVKLSNNPTLNEILLQTDPIQSGENPYDVYGALQTDIVAPPINVPTNDMGLPIHSVPNHVLEAMNRDYSGMFVNKEKPKQQPKAPVQQTRELIKDKFISMMEGNNEMSAQASAGELSDDEWGDFD